MRIFELSTHVKSISRGTGASATAAAAYRACCAIECEIDGKTHDYTRKSGLEASAIVLPERRTGMGGRPRQALERGRVEGTERQARGKNAGQLKRNAALAREFMFSFPVELSEAGRLQGARKRLPGTLSTHTASRLTSPSTSPARRAISAISIATC